MLSSTCSVFCSPFVMCFCDAPTAICCWSGRRQPCNAFRDDSPFESLRAHSDANAQVLPLVMVDMLVFMLPISRCILLRCQQSNSELYILCLV